MAEAFDITTDAGAGVVTLALRGELDVDTARRLDAAVSDLDLERVDRVVVDLAGLSFIDSSGMQALRRTQRRVEGADRELGFTRPQGAAARALDLVGMLDRLPLAERA